jgi:sterol carrier protein 2
VSERTYVIGVGMTKFDKPGTKEGDYPDWVREAATAALADADVDYTAIEQVFAGYCYGDSTYGQRAVYGLGLTGVPVMNVNNNCSTGSSALWLARQAVRGGLARCVMAVGFEKMERGSLGMKYTDRTSALDRHVQAMIAGRGGWEESPPAPQMFGNAGREHMERYGSRPEHFAWIGYKNHRHSVNNPYAQFQTAYTLEEIESSPVIHSPLTKLQCSPTSDGAACAIVASESFVEAHDLGDRAVEIAGQAVVTDLASTFDGSNSSITICGADMSREAARLAYEEAQVGPTTSTWSSCTTASAPTSSSPTRRSGSPPRARVTSSSTPRRPPTAAPARWSTRPADSSPRATRSGPPAWRSARS